MGKRGRLAGGECLTLAADGAADDHRGEPVTTVNEGPLHVAEAKVVALGGVAAAGPLAVTADGLALVEGNLKNEECGVGVYGGSAVRFMVSP